MSWRLSDTGEGIEEDNVNRIFEPFFTTRVSAKKVGLGLFIAKRFIENRGDMIRVETSVGKGSTFILSFPGHAR